jgi:hypothetical protein
MNKCKKEGKKLKTHNLKLYWFKIIFEITAHKMLYILQTKYEMPNISTQKENTLCVICLSTAHISELK